MMASNSIGVKRPRRTFGLRRFLVTDGRPLSSVRWLTRVFLLLLPSQVRSAH